MAHSCPNCGQACYCGGDVDDCLDDFEEDVIACTHCEMGDEYDDYEEYDDEASDAPTAGQGGLR
jgi:hypothetical protein